MLALAVRRLRAGTARRRRARALHKDARNSWSVPKMTRKKPAKKPDRQITKWTLKLTLLKYFMCSVDTNSNALTINVHVYGKNAVESASFTGPSQLFRLIQNYRHTVMFTTSSCWFSPTGADKKWGDYSRFSYLYVVFSHTQQRGWEEDSQNARPRST